MKDTHIEEFLRKKRWKLLQYAIIKGSAKHRKMIGQGLVKFQEQQAIPLLEKLLTDNVQEVAKEAVCALQQMNTPETTTKRIENCIQYWIKHEEHLKNTPRKSYDNWMDRDKMVRLAEAKEKLKERPMGWR